MKIYIASHDKPKAVELAETLAGHGHEITSGWIASTVNIHGAPDHVRAYAVRENLKDIDSSEAIVVIAAPKGEMVPGGKHFEAGYAVAKRKALYILGGPENLYHWCEGAELVFDTPALVETLAD